jgi:hypothetical protein
MFYILPVFIRWWEISSYEGWGCKEDNWSKNWAVERESPFREDMSPEAEKQPLLGAVTRQLLMKTLRARKDSVCSSEL